MSGPVYLLDEQMEFPSVEDAADEEGLVAVGGNLTIPRLLEAYRKGIFPWYEDGFPLLWWSPAPRMVLYPEKMKVSKSLRASLNNSQITVKFDHNFKEVINQCARVPRPWQHGTWITEDMKQAYNRFHKEGYAHSVETYFNHELVGGLYGVSLGKMFFGESMFHLKPDASKVALYYLCKALKSWDFHLIDSQVETGHMKRMGGELMDRRQFLQKLETALSYPTKRGSWNFNE
ncbi:MAG: leucyl/phenylalanyl-tRNA--protein transferase [Bacteroidales bacterium]|nr:leucyl/phenylalanyl-tRNA--protein transferase [Bacteroidales bacterium]